MQARRLVVGLILALTAPSIAAPAQAGCRSVCDLSAPGCVRQKMVCTPDSPGAPRTPGSQVSYGAIAYGATSGAFGYSYHWGSQAQAGRVAMKNCAQHGDDCQVLVWFDRRCGAVVSGGNTTAFWGLGADAAEASTDAENKCTQGGATDCVVQVTQCSM